MSWRKEPARGQAMVEFALVLVTVLLFMLGLLDLGRVVFSGNGLSHAVREATRQASVSPLDCESMFYLIQLHTSRDPSVTATVEVRKKPSITNPTPTPAVVCSGYNPALSYDNDPSTGAQAAAPFDPLVPGLYEVQVLAGGDVDLVTPIVAQLAGGHFDLAADSRMVITFVPS